MANATPPVAAVAPSQGKRSVGVLRLALFLLPAPILLAAIIGLKGKNTTKLPHPPALPPHSASPLQSPKSAESATQSEQKRPIMQQGRRISTATPGINQVHAKLLDVVVNPLSAEEATDLIFDHVERKETLVLGNLNLHGVYVYHTNKEFARYCNSCDVVLIDGAPVAWAARVPLAFRIGSTDWLDVLMPRAAGLKILAIGGTPESSQGAEKHFRTKFPEVGWTGVDGYTGNELTDELTALIAEADIVLVGMGMPLQEAWIMKHRALFEHKVVANVGGCLDYYSGAQLLAPRWMGRAGIEWLFRLVVSPTRLAHRYLIEPFKLGAVLALRRLRALI